MTVGTRIAIRSRLQSRLGILTKQQTWKHFSSYRLMLLSSDRDPQTGALTKWRIRNSGGESLGTWPEGYCDFQLGMDTPDSCNWFHSFRFVESEEHDRRLFPKSASFAPTRHGWSWIGGCCWGGPSHPLLVSDTPYVVGLAQVSNFSVIP